MSKFKKLILVIICVILLGLCEVLRINDYVKSKYADRIIDSFKASELEKVDAILILGCGVKSNGQPSDMLKDRLDRGIELYNLNVAPKIIMSGDHGQEDYDEVNVMKQYAIDAGIDSSDIFMDHAGFSTYESMYRAKAIFDCKKIVIVTQEYHLFRGVYIANSLGIDAYGVSSDYHQYVNQYIRDIREVLARNKDFFTSFLKIKPTYLGDKIPISGDGNQTNDKHVFN